MSVGSDYYSTSTVARRQQEEKAALSSGKVTHTDFLKLLTKQLTSQDPLNPMQDIDFTAQLAQLQALDEQMAMTKSVQAMRIDTQIQAGTNMIGKYISGADSSGNSVTGKVKRVTQQDSNIYLELTTGQKVTVGDVANIWNDEDSMIRDLSNSSNAIGMWIEAGYDDARQPIKGIVESVTVQNGQVLLTLYGGKSVGWDKVAMMRVPTEDELWYTLPDDLRKKVEKAQGMMNMGVTGVDDDGKTQYGIVSGAKLDGQKVYLELYGGGKLDIDKVDGGARVPTAADAAKSLKDLWVIGLDEEGKDAAGQVVGAESSDNGILLQLSNGKYLYLDSVTKIREATAEDLAGDAPAGNGGETAESETP